jgi:two-component system, NtrC family, nitrogen regulation sensor histidine kinase NtrY
VLRPSLRARFVIYLVAVHACAGALGVYLLLQQRAWLYLVEIVLVASLVTGIALVNRLFRALSFVDDSAQFLHDSDYTARFLEVGQPEVDRLVAVYNRMVDHLRTERRRVQEQHLFLASVLDVSPSGIVVLDYDGRLDLVNPATARLAQESSDSLRGRMLGQSGVPVIDELVSLEPGAGRVINLHGGRRVRAQHGRFLDHGFPRSFFLLEELTEELRQSEKAAYEKLIRMLSHEVNNSVAASRSLLESSLGYGAQLQASDRGDFERALQIAIDRMGHLNAFMRSFADVVRLPAPVPQPTDLEELVRHVEGLTRSMREPRGIQWTWAVESPLPPIALDRVQMEQALLNITKNAIEAIDGPGTITARIRLDRTRAQLVIENTGPGISESIRSQLFTPFFTTKAGGQGIGLTVVQEILANHRFDYALESPPGGPTRFTIRF